MNYKPDGISLDGLDARRPVSFRLRGWAGIKELKSFRPAHPSIYLFRAIDASGGQLFVKSWTKTFYYYDTACLQNQSFDKNL